MNMENEQQQNFNFLTTGFPPETFTLKPGYNYLQLPTIPISPSSGFLPINYGLCYADPINKTGDIKVTESRPIALGGNQGFQWHMTIFSGEANDLKVLAGPIVVSR